MTRRRRRPWLPRPQPWRQPTPAIAEALLAVEEADDLDLSWYARQELELLVG